MSGRGGRFEIKNGELEQTEGPDLERAKQEARELASKAKVADAKDNPPDDDAGQGGGNTAAPTAAGGKRENKKTGGTAAAKE